MSTRIKTDEQCTRDLNSSKWNYGLSTRSCQHYSCSCCCSVCMRHCILHKILLNELLFLWLILIQIFSYDQISGSYMDRIYLNCHHLKLIILLWFIYSMKIVSFIAINNSYNMYPTIEIQPLWFFAANQWIANLYINKYSYANTLNRHTRLGYTHRAIKMLPFFLRSKFNLQTEFNSILFDYLISVMWFYCQTKQHRNRLSQFWFKKKRTFFKFEIFLGMNFNEF